MCIYLTMPVAYVVSIGDRTPFQRGTCVYGIVAVFAKQIFYAIFPI